MSTRTKPPGPPKPPKPPSRTKAPSRNKTATRTRVPVEPRLRERWIAARRAEGRRRLRVVVIAGAIAVALALGWAATASPFLDVDHIVVKGTSRLPAAEVQAASGIQHGDPMVWIDGGAAVTGIDALPYVRAARVEREWPGTVTITISERRAVAWVENGVGPALVDRTGRVLERVVAPPADLPQIASPQLVPPVGASIEPTVGARVAGQLQGFFRSGTRSISLTPGGVALGLVNGPEIRLGEPTAVMTKMRAAMAVLTALDGEAVEYIDATVPANPVAGPVVG